MLAPRSFTFPKRLALIGVGLLVLLATNAPAPSPVAAQRATPTPRATRPGPGQGGTPGAPLNNSDDHSMMATWRPEYTSWLTLPGDESPITLAADPSGSALWMATGTTVARLMDGVWSTPEQPTDADHIYAMAVNDKAVWAVGWSGGAWRRNGSGYWREVASNTIGDLYAIDATAADGAVWAAGFDYETASGVIVRWDDGPAGPGNGPSALWTNGDLSALQLYAVTVDRAGTPWVGGCRITGWDEADWQPVLLRFDGGEWIEVAQPLATGCVYGMAFAEDGAGWAAAGDDLLSWDGQSWQAENVAPPTADPDADPPVPEGVAWMRVEAGRITLGEDGPQRSAWAVAGVPTWSGYIRGQTPWRFDGSEWAPAPVDYRGLPTKGLDVDTEIEPRSFMALAGDGTRAWSVNRTLTGAGDAATAFAAIVALEEETVVLAHPLVLQPVSVAVPPAPPDGALTTFVAGRLGSLPLARSGEVSWLADPDFRFEPPRRSQQPRRSHLDLPSVDRGWQLTVAGPVSGSLAVAHRWDGERWHAQAAPRGLRQLRTLPDGGAWGRQAKLGGRVYKGQMMRLESETWRPIEGAPEPSEASPLCNRLAKDGSGSSLNRQDCDVPRAPFDAVAREDDGSGDRQANIVGWLAGADRRMYRWDGRSFEARGEQMPGPVLDVALTDDGGGWAIVHDAAADPPTDRLARLGNDRWRIADQSVRRHPQLRVDVIAIEWQEMAPISEREIWLRGRVFAPRIGRGDRVLVHLRGNVVEVFPLTCNVSAMAAARVPDGTDLWLLGDVDVEGCRMDRFPIPVYPHGDAITGRYERISRLRIRDRQGLIALPWMAR